MIVPLRLSDQTVWVVIFEFYTKREWSAVYATKEGAEFAPDHRYRNVSMPYQRDVLTSNMKKTIPRSCNA